MRALGRSSSGRPLSSDEWLVSHHRAKLPERKLFAGRLAELSPKRIIDLGCGTGLWLDLLDESVDSSCEFCGIDADADAIALAEQRAVRWQRKWEFHVQDIEGELAGVLPGDLYLGFNVAGYLNNPAAFLAKIGRHRLPDGKLVIRQYDGATMRFGPMGASARGQMDQSLFAGVGGSVQFNHYALDDLFGAIDASDYKHKDLEFELFQRFSPFNAAFARYLSNTVEWNSAFLNERGQEDIYEWLATTATRGAYFSEVDLVAVLS